MDDEARSLGRAKAQTLDRLAAVRLLLSTERRAAENDILLATAYECLRTGPKSEPELVQFAEDTWPGASVNPVSFRAALEAAREMSFLDTSQGLGQTVLWSFGTKSVGDIDASTVWADQAMTRCEEFLSREVAKAFGAAVVPDDVHRWFEVLVIALFDGIKTAFLGGGEIRLFKNDTLIVRNYDVDVVVERIRSLVDQREVSVFIEGMAIAALDPSQAFGSELVHFIATGYALHAFLARRDHQAARQTIGTLRGQEVLLDTPALMPLLGPAVSANSIRQAIEVARGAEMHVVVHEETLLELVAAVQRVEDLQLPSVMKDLDAGTSPEVLAALMAGTPISLWLQAKAAGEISHWPHFKERVKVLPRQLSDLGVEIRSPDQRGAHEFRERQAVFYQALDEVLTETNAHRGNPNIDHDAGLMVAVELERVTNPRRDDQLWPGATVVTTDTRFSEAYRRASAEMDVLPAAVTPSQWLVLMTECADPATIEQLAQAATTEVGRETMLSIATRFPIEVSQSVARVLSEDKSASVSDVGTAQLTMEDLLRSQPDLVSEPTRASVQIASEVLVHRSRRLAGSAVAQQEFANDARVRAEVEAALAQQRADDVQEEVVATRSRLDAEQKARTEAEAARDYERSRAKDQERAAEAELKKELEAAKRRAEDDQSAARESFTRERGEDRRRSSRKIRVALAVGFLIAVGVLFAVAGLWLAAAATALSIILLWHAGVEWAENLDHRWTRLLVSLIPQILTVLELLLG